MNQLNSRKFWKAVGRERRLRYICIAVFTLIAIVVGALGLLASQRDLKPIDYFANMDTKVNKIVYIDVAYAPFLFASKGEEYGKLYFVWDVNDYIYIVDLLSNDAEQLEAATYENPIRIVAKTKAIDDNIKKVAIRAYNKSKGEDMSALTNANFEDYIGVYLFARDTATLANASVYYAAAAISLAIALIFVIARIYAEMKIKRAIGKLSPAEADMIANEIESSDTIVFEKIPLFLTRNYIISLGRTLHITNYSDVEWVYHTDIYQKGVLSARRVNIITHDNKDPWIPTHPYGKHSSEHVEIINIIAEKNPNIIIGYNRDNILTAKQMQKERRGRK